MHPGWVTTEMTGNVADIEPGERVEGVRAVISKMTMAVTGSFLKWTGDIHPWQITGRLYLCGRFTLPPQLWHLSGVDY